VKYPEVRGNATGKCPFFLGFPFPCSRISHIRTSTTTITASFVPLCLIHDITICLFSAPLPPPASSTPLPFGIARFFASSGCLCSSSLFLSQSGSFGALFPLALHVVLLCIHLCIFRIVPRIVFLCVPLYPLHPSLCPQTSPTFSVQCCCLPPAPPCASNLIRASVPFTFCILCPPPPSHLYLYTTTATTLLPAVFLLAAIPSCSPRSVLPPPASAATSCGCCSDYSTANLVLIVSILLISSSAHLLTIFLIPHRTYSHSHRFL
jgi:hypothetical protein